MKKNMLFFSALIVSALLFSSCKGKSPAQQEEPIGNVTLEPATTQLVYGATVTLTPKYEPGRALQYEWSSSADSIVSVKADQGGLGKIQAHRIGDATIYYKGYDKKSKALMITATTTVSVMPRSQIFGMPYFKKGESKTTLNAMGIGTLNSDQSTDKLLVYDRSPEAVNKVHKYVFQLDANDKLMATYAYIEDNSNNRLEASNYIEERFKLTSKVEPPFTVYNAGVSGSYAPGTYSGLFLGTDPGNGITGLGIKFW